MELDLSARASRKQEAALEFDLILATFDQGKKMNLKDLGQLASGDKPGWRRLHARGMVPSRKETAASVSSFLDRVGDG